MRILIVDDDAVTRRMLRLVLQTAGHEVEEAVDGLAALDALAAGAARVVICDWEMPRMDGPGFCRAVRSTDYPGYVYVLLLTARTGSRYMIEGLQCGADDFVSKPFDPEELTVRLQTAERVLALESRDLLIFAMAKLAESRDSDTGAHLERVRGYSRLLTEHLAGDPAFATVATPAFVRTVYLTSPLHDIGKVAIPDHVLLKPGRLSDREFEIMKTHATMGAQTLDAALREHPEATFLRVGRDIALTHHERWDGTGYPGGLAGDAIPLCGRIVAVADVYDALTSRRVYKGAFAHDVARAIIERDSGTHFDPRIVQAFLAVESRWLAMRDRMADTAAAAQAA